MITTGSPPYTAHSANRHGYHRAPRWNQNWTGTRTKKQQKQDMEGGGIDG